MIYLDTSALVSLMTREPETPRVMAWFEANEAPLVTGEWARVEFASALAAKARAKLLRRADLRAAHDVFTHLVSSGVRLLPVSRAAVDRAARLCAIPADNLRAGDALHLGIALEAGAQSLAGLDVAMNAAAVRAGLSLAL